MSDFFVWDPKRYSVYVKEMDEQHQVLISSMNDLYLLNEARASKEQFLQSLLKLEELISDHFSKEEHFFDSIKFSDSEGHKKIHQELLKRYRGFIKEYELGGSSMKVDFFNFLKIWLSAHIASADRKYGEYFKNLNKAA